MPSLLPPRPPLKNHKFQLLFIAIALLLVTRVVAFFGGLQSGKSVAGADAVHDLLYSKSALKLPPQAAGQIPEVWILSKSYVLAQAALNTFKWRAGEAFFSDAECRKYGLKRDDKNSYWLRPSIYGDRVPIMLRVRTAHDPEALRATPVLLLAWCDEMAHWPEMAWMNLQGRGIVTRTKFVITTTPKGKNWLYRDIYIPGEENDKPNPDESIVAPDERGQIRIVKCRSVDNPFADKKYIAALAKKMGPDYAAQELEGLFTDSTGLVYPIFDRKMHLRRLPKDKLELRGAERNAWLTANFPVRIIGCDPGYGDPYAAVVCLRDNERRWWIVGEMYEAKNADTLDVVPWFKSSIDLWNVQRVFVDKRRPADVKVLRKCGINAVANYELYEETSKKTIMPMVRVVNAIFRENRIAGIDPDCDYTIDEFENYSYPDKDSKNRGENPVDWKNHAMDAIRYAIVSVEGVNYEGPGQIFRNRRTGEFKVKAKQGKILKPLVRTLGQALAQQDREDEEKEKHGRRYF